VEEFSAHQVAQVIGIIGQDQFRLEGVAFGSFFAFHGHRMSAGEKRSGSTANIFLT
jgi:hypothetical protein